MRSAPTSLLLLLASIIVAAASCAPPAPERVDLTPWTVRIGDREITPEQLQSAVMTAADNYMSRSIAAVNEFIDANDSREHQIWAQRAKIESAQSVLAIASSSNPIVSMVDLLIMVSLQRRAVEQYWIPERIGPQAQPLLDALKAEEDRLWRQAKAVLTDDDLQR
ncbi:MAG: hypothetical protein VYC34_01690, partial [Planctomycetota bacterium]|nr:hypothetical protein [Planctomycetota bacterium]